MKHDLKKRFSELDEAVKVIKERVMIDKPLPKSTYENEVIFSSDPNAQSVVI
jgi:hypothetical protein